MEKSYSQSLRKLAKIDDLLFDDFKKMVEEEKERLDNLALEIEQAKSKQDKIIKTKDKMGEIRKAISELKNVSKLTRDEILRYVDIVRINPNGSIDVVLNIGGAYAFPIQAFIRENVGNISIYNN